jgi:hypothetical protein
MHDLLGLQLVVVLGAAMLVELRSYVERVTGIEPAWPAWKAGVPKVPIRWSQGSWPYAVPSVCLC